MKAPRRFLALLLALAAIPLPVQAAPRASQDELVVFASSSLAPGFREFATFHDSTGKALSARFEFAGGQAVREWIERGKAADVVATADSIHIRALWRAGKVEEPHLLAHGRLVLITAASNVELTSFVSLTRPGLKIASAARGVPLAHYTDLLMLRMEMSYHGARRLTSSIHVNLTGDQPSASAVLEQVERGAADAGIVYATDAEAAADKVRTLRMPDSFSPQVEYYVATVTASPRRAAAEAFVSCVTGAAGQEILRRHGFEPVPVAP